MGLGKVLCASKSKSKPNKKKAVFLGNAFLVTQTEAGKIAVCRTFSGGLSLEIWGMAGIV